MKWEIGPIEVQYDEERAAVEVQGQLLDREQVFKLQAVLRSLYNHIGRRRQQEAEDAALRSLGLNKLHRMARES